jgi:hypothetical protein
MKKKLSKLDVLREKKAAYRKIVRLYPEEEETLKPIISQISEEIRAGMDPKSREVDAQVSEMWDSWKEAKAREDQEEMDRLKDEIGEMYRYIKEEGLENVS